jgi:hypothetical protein
MNQKDITNDLQRFRTVRTVKNELRARELETTKNAVPHNSQWSGKQASEPSELAPDCLPWLHVAKQVLAGEFHGADKSMRQSLVIGLRSIRHPDCQAALARIKT